MGIWQAVDKRMARVAALGIVLDACRVILSVSRTRSGRTIELTSSIDELGVELRREQRLGQVAEELLHQACNTIDIMVEVLRAGKVNLRGVWIHE